MVELAHERLLTDLFWKGLTTAGSQHQQPSLAMKSGSIPDDLKPPGYEFSTLVLSGQEALDYFGAEKKVRLVRETEYLTDREVKDRIWRALCEMHVRSAEFTKKRDVQQHVRSFLGDLYRPFEKYRALFVVQHLQLEEALSFSGYDLVTADREFLCNWGLDDIDDPIRSPSRFEDQTVIEAPVLGNDARQTAERARIEAENCLKVLQMHFTDNLDIVDEQLIFQLGDYALRRESDTRIVLVGFTKPRRPLGFFLGNQRHAKIRESIGEFGERTGELPKKLRERVERAVYWIAEAVSESQADQKILHLSTALETVLTTKDDRLKGEAIAYRMLILLGHYKEPFLAPSRLLALYELRSAIVHGSAIGVATEPDYYRLLYVTKQVLRFFIRFSEEKKVRSIGKVIEAMELSEKAEEVVGWLSSSRNTREKRIADALEAAIERRRSK